MRQISAATRIRLYDRLARYEAERDALLAQLQQHRAHYQQACEDEAAAAQDVGRLEAGRRTARRHTANTDALEAFSVEVKRAKDRRAAAHTRRLEAYSDGMMARYRLDIVKRQAQEAADKLGVSFIE